MPYSSNPPPAHLSVRLLRSRNVSQGAVESQGEGEGRKKGGRGGKGKDPPATAEKLDSALESYWGNGNGKAADTEEVHTCVTSFSVKYGVCGVLVAGAGALRLACRVAVCWLFLAWS